MSSQNAAQGRAELCEIFSDALSELQAIDPDASLLQNVNGGLEEWFSGSTLLGKVKICDLSTNDASLQVYLLDDGIPGMAGSAQFTALGFGYVFITNPYFTLYGQDSVINAANVVYEPTARRLGWQICRFHWPKDWEREFRNDFGDPLPFDESRSRYFGYGPSWHTHGLSYDNFPWHEREKAVPSKSLARRIMSRKTASYEFRSNKERYNQTMTVVPLTPTTALQLFQEALDLRPPPNS